MSNRIHIAIVLLTGLIAVTSTTARAEGLFPGGRSWAVGFGLVTSPSPFVDHSTRVWPVPVIAYAGERLQVMGPEMSLSIVRSSLLSFDLAAGTRFEGFKPDESSALAGMSERKLAFEMGGRLSLPVVTLKYRADVSGTHRGHELTLAHTRSYELLSTSILPSVSATWKSSELSNYYYGVRLSEATAERAAYRPGATTSFGIGMEMVKQINWNWTLVGSAGHEFLSSDITDSPIVEDSGQTSLSVFLIRIL